MAELDRIAQNLPVKKKPAIGNNNEKLIFEFNYCWMLNYG
jgi:hypothetical protein